MGILGRTPLAGVSWQVLHFLEGFRRLGHDVYYIEDTGGWAYNPLQKHTTMSPNVPMPATANTPSVIWPSSCLRSACRIVGLTSPGLTDRVFGLSKTQVSRLFESADALVNLTGSTQLFEEHTRVPVRIYLETDPVTRQIEVAHGDRKAIDLLEAHTHYFTYGENFGAPDCSVPLTGFHYHPTRQPIVLRLVDT